MTDAATEHKVWQDAFTFANDLLAKDRRQKIQPQDFDETRHSFQGYDQLLQEAQEACSHRTANRSPRFEKLRSALEALRDHAPILDVIAQQQPIAAFVWGSIRLIIKVSADALEVNFNITQSIAKYVGDIDRCQRHLRTSAISNQVVQESSRFLGLIIYYLAHAKTFLLGPKIRRAVKAAFSQKLKQIAELIKDQDQLLRREIAVVEGQGQVALRKDCKRFVTTTEREFAEQSLYRAAQEKSREVVAGQLCAMIKQTEEQSTLDEAHRICTKLLDWLGPTLQTAPTRVPTPGTCEWISRCAAWQSWESSGCHGCLVISGLMGCGKSTLGKYLADSTRSEFAFRHHFNCAHRQKISAPSQFAIALLARIVANNRIAHNGSFYSKIEKALLLTNLYSSAVDCNTDSLLNILDGFLELLPSYTIVVDALDECAEEIKLDEVDKLLDYLRKIGLRASSRVIVLSRSGCFSPTMFVETIQISMSESVVNPDIERFTEHEIEELCSKRPKLCDLKSMIVSTVSGACNGMFLMAKFMVDDVTRAATVKEMKVRLKDFPCELNECYLKQYDTVGGTLQEDQKALRDSVLLILLATYEQLNVETVSAILALDTTSNSTDESDLLLLTVFDISRLCAPFLYVAKDQLTFAHASARNFLETHIAPRDNADEYLALKCLSKLSERQFQQWQYAARLLHRNLLPRGLASETSGPTLDDSEFYRYACLYWQDHVTALPRPSDEVLTKLRQFLVGFEFVSASETLLKLKANGGIGIQVQVKSTLSKWYEALPQKLKKNVPIDEFYVTAHETLSITLREEGGDILLQYLPFVRLGQYFNVGGRTSADFQRAITYKSVVAEGYEKALGPRNQLTLRAKTALLREFFFQKRFDEAERGLRDIARIQREVIGEHDLDYFMTLLLLGGAEQSVTKFEPSILTLTQAADGFRRLAGKEALNTLITQMCKGQSLERVARYEEAYQLYQELLETWVRVGDPKHPFSSMLKTSIGSASRQLRRFSESEDVLLETFSQRERLFGDENVTYIDSALQLAALYYESQQGDEGLKVLKLILSAKVLGIEFERRCQLIHIRALIDLRADRFKAIADLTEILNEVSGDGRDRNNRELLWVRITLSDALRQCGKDDEALMVFSDLVEPCTDDGQSSQDETQAAAALLFPQSLADEPETPGQLALAEEALRLVRAANPEEAERLLQKNSLQWRRKADFWVLQGGPFTDTASMSGLGDREYIPSHLGSEPRKSRTKDI